MSTLCSTILKSYCNSKISMWLMVMLALSITDNAQAKPPFNTLLLTSNGLFPANATQQEEVEIVGSIKDASSHKNVVNATIVLAGTNFSTRSQADGSFRLLVPEQQLKTIFFKLAIAATGYKSKEVEAAITAGIPRIDVLLRKRR